MSSDAVDVANRLLEQLLGMSLRPGPGTFRAAVAVQRLLAALARKRRTS